MQILIIAFVTVILIILVKYCIDYGDRSSDRFSDLPSEIIYTQGDNNKKVQVNEEVLVLEQQPGKDREIKFQYLKAPLNSHIVINVYRENPNSAPVKINAALSRIELVSTDVLKLLGSNNVLVADLQNVIKYYIKVLDNNTYATEKAEYNKMRAMAQKYSNCLNVKKTTMSYPLAVAECKKEFNL